MTPSREWRIAGLIASHAARQPGQTLAAVRRRLSSQDRKMFIESCAFAVLHDWVVITGGRLHPGPKAQPANLRTDYVAGVQQAIAQRRRA